MATPAEVVSSSFAQAQNYASNAQTALTSFTNALNANLYTPPTFSAAWATIAPPAPQAVGAVPAIPTIAFVMPTGEPAALDADMPAINVGTFDEAAPVLNLPNAPVVSYGLVPLIPDVADIALPAAPTLAIVAAPSYLALNTPTFGGVDLHADYLSRLDDIPTLSLVAPTPYSYSPGAQYASDLLSGLKATLNGRLAGGTGLAPAVEQAIWDRARSRETQLGLANEAEVMRSSEACGFQLPSGVLAAQLREAQQGYYDKLSGLSRDVAIKQAELEQANLKDTIAAGMDLEGKLIDYSLKLEQLAFDAAKTLADNAIQCYNAQIEQFKALLSGYQAYAAAYDTIIKGELAKVEVFKAQLSGEQTKAQINLSLVQQYKAEIEAGLAYVEIFKAQISAANTLVQLEQTKISAAGEQIKGYVAQVNAETAKVEAYKAGIQGEQVKVEVYKTKAGVFGTLAGVQADKARAEIARFGALAQAKASEWEGYKVRVLGETARVQALGTATAAAVDGYKAGAHAAEAQGNMNARMWESSIKQYEAGHSIALQTAKLNGDFAMQAGNARLEASKVGAQVYAQLTASAYGMIHASAGVSAGSTNSVSYSYSNDTASAAPTITSI